METFYLVDSLGNEIQSVPAETLCNKIREGLSVNIVIKRNLYVIVKRTECNSSLIFLQFFSECWRKHGKDFIFIYTGF